MRSVTCGEPPDDRLAWDHDLCRAVVGRTMRAILGFLRRRARDAGVTDGRGGAVAILQRFGGALNLNVHIHALVVDGVFADQRDRLGRIARYALRPPVAQDRLVWTDAGQVRLELRRSWSDGTTHLLFDPVELLERLACPRCGGRLTLIALIDDPA